MTASVSINKDLVSVIIPHYNCSDYLSDCLSSIYRQSYNYFEVIVVDDGSLFKEREKAREICSAYNVSFHKLNENRGAPYARNYGARFANGEYLFFCDSDVILNDFAFEKFLKSLYKNPSCSWSYCNFHWGDKSLYFYPFDRTRLYRYNFSSTMSMIRRVDFPGWDENLVKLQDWDLFLTMHENGCSGVWVCDYLFSTLDNPNGITRNTISESKAREEIRKKHPNVRKNAYENFGISIPNNNKWRRDISPLKTTEIENSFIRGLVSVIIPHYNCSDYLSDCLSSIYRQSYNYFEVIVVDDGSVFEECGNAEEICSAYNASFHKLNENMGAPYARNYGARFANGEYLFFCDSDVNMYQRSFELFVNTLIDDNSIDFAYGSFNWGDEQIISKDWDLESLKIKNYITTMSMIRSSKFRGFDESLKRHQDWDLWLTMGLSNCKGKFTKEFMFDAPKREGGISSSANISISESKEIIYTKHNLGL